jgi:hypothetical protein
MTGTDGRLKVGLSCSNDKHLACAIYNIVFIFY